MRASVDGLDFLQEVQLRDIILWFPTCLQFYVAVMFSLIKELSKHGLKAVAVERFASFQISHGCGGKMAVAYKRNGELYAMCHWISL